MFLYFEATNLTKGKKASLVEDTEKLWFHLLLIDWELNRHTPSWAVRVSEEVGDFLKVHKKFHDSVDSIIRRASGYDSGIDDVEEIRMIQNQFDKSARGVHLMLCNLTNDRKHWIKLLDKLT